MHTISTHRLPVVTDTTRSLSLASKYPKILGKYIRKREVKDSSSLFHSLRSDPVSISISQALFLAPAAVLHTSQNNTYNTLAEYTQLKHGRKWLVDPAHGDPLVVQLAPSQPVNHLRVGGVQVSRVQVDHQVEIVPGEGGVRCRLARPSPPSPREGLDKSSQVRIGEM